MALHFPVLLEEVLRVFEGVKLVSFFEGTVGMGGHARALLQAHPEIERYLACDRDRAALQIAREELKPWGKKVEWIAGPFAELGHFLHERGVSQIDGAFFDVGVSSMQLDEGERGFSFRREAPLDMRMDPEGEGATAEDLIHSLSEEKLARIFYEYGEERRSRKLARAIVLARKRKRIRTTSELIAVIDPFLYKGGRIHPATRVFQALRIAVNDELGQLEKGLAAAVEALSIGGRIAAISFHSLEDRIVKRCFKEDKRLVPLMKKPIGPSLEERKKNPRSRSAKLRAAEKGEL